MFGLIDAWKPLSITMLADFLLMELDSGRLTVIVVLVSHWIRSWWSTDSGDSTALRSELAAVRTEILRAEQTIKFANHSLESCLGVNFLQSLALKCIGLFVLQCVLIAAGYLVYRKYLLRGVFCEAPVVVDLPAALPSPVSSGKSPEPSKVTPIPVRSRGPVRPSDLKRLADQYGQ